MLSVGSTLLAILAVLSIVSFGNAAPAQDAGEADAAASNISVSSSGQENSSVSTRPTTWAWTIVCLTADRSLLTRCAPNQKRDISFDDASPKDHLEARHDGGDASTPTYNLYTASCRRLCACASNGDFTCQPYGVCTSEGVSLSCRSSGQCQCAFREVLAGDTAKLGSYSLSNAVGINGGSSNGWGDNWVRGFGDQDDDAE